MVRAEIECRAAGVFSMKWTPVRVKKTRQHKRTACDDGAWHCAIPFAMRLLQQLSPGQRRITSAATAECGYSGED